MSASPTARKAVLAGATGLVGRALLSELIASRRYAQVHALLRRAAPDLPADPKLRVQQIDFGRLPALPAVDDVFITLGTTIKVAGSQDAFRRVDFDAVLNTARAARAAGATQLVVVSALGADAKSRVFYNRVKGEMEGAVAEVGFDSVVIAQPSLLVGDRAALGQPLRAGEVWAKRLFGWVPGNMRPIDAATVARALMRAALEAAPGKRVLSSAQMQTMGT
ncbi:MAG TPA: NAD(P)H-binding protein [Albitalea sp.]|jgi:uncharacterized protein YbjT (DUF2867 family)|nr:NAD(P)H-binding protein [Albitalea sp.]